VNVRDTALLAWLKRVRDALGSGWAERVASSLVIVAVAVGLVLRARGFVSNPPAFWLDEAVWAMNLTERPLVQNLIRPPGFILVSKALAAAFSPTETVLRALPWLAAVGALVISPWVAGRLFGSLASRLFFVAAIALNPCLIDFSKEFKPYAIGFLFHLLLIPFTLRYVDSGRGRDLGVVLGLATVGILFAQDLIFAFPGVFLVLGYEAYKHRRGHLAVIAGGAALLVVMLLGQYFLLWRHLPKDGTEYWGTKYNVFFTGANEESYLEWSLERFRDMTGFPGIRRDYWQNGGFSFEERRELRAVDRFVWLGLFLVGSAVLVRRRRLRLIALLVLPLFALWVFNALGHWPMGAFRTNLFSLVYTISVSSMAADAPEGARSRWLAPVPTLIIVALPLFVFEKVWHERKQAFTYDSQLPKLMARLIATRQGTAKSPLILDRRTCQPWRFYTDFHPRTSRAYAETLKQSFDARCLTDDAQIPDGLVDAAMTRQPIWIVLHPGHHVERLARTHLRGLYRVSRFSVGPHTVMSFRRRTLPLR
jgi:hypothetical protein